MPSSAFYALLKIGQNQFSGRQFAPATSQPWLQAKKTTTYKQHSEVR